MPGPVPHLHPRAPPPPLPPRRLLPAPPPPHPTPQDCLLALSAVAGQPSNQGTFPFTAPPLTAYTLDSFAQPACPSGSAAANSALGPRLGGECVSCGTYGAAAVGGVGGRRARACVCVRVCQCAHAHARVRARAQGGGRQLPATQSSKPSGATWPQAPLRHCSSTAVRACQLPSLPYSDPGRATHAHTHTVHTHTHAYATHTHTRAHGRPTHAHAHAHAPNLAHQPTCMRRTGRACAAPA